MAPTPVDVVAAPAEVSLAFVVEQWHRISAELEAERAMTRLAEMLEREPCWDDLRVLAGAQAAELDPAGRLMRLMATQRVQAFLAGTTVSEVVGLVGEGEPASPLAERSNRHEVALALGRSKDQARFLIATYRRMVAEFPEFVAALTAGRITMGHCYALHEETLVVTDPEAMARIAAGALPAARSMSSGAFRAAVRRLVVRHDPDAAERRRQARRRRGVRFSDLGDGVSSMTVVGRTEDLHAVRDVVQDAAAQLVAADTDACAADPGRDPLTLPQARSDAVVAALLGERAEDGTITYAPREHTTTHLELVVDAATAAGIRDNLARAGSDPIVAGIARALMVDADTIARVLVADGTRALLETSPRTYLTPRQRRHITRRDRLTCRCCGRRARRGQMDHLIPFLDGGPSVPGNEWWLCIDCHQRKTADQLHVAGDADGTVTITTPAGIVFTSGPPPYLDDPDLDARRPARTVTFRPRRSSDVQHTGDPPPF